MSVCHKRKRDDYVSGSVSDVMHISSSDLSDTTDSSSSSSSSSDSSDSESATQLQPKRKKVAQSIDFKSNNNNNITKSKFAQLKSEKLSNKELSSYGKHALVTQNVTSRWGNCSFLDPVANKFVLKGPFHSSNQTARNRIFSTMERIKILHGLGLGKFTLQTCELLKHEPANTHWLRIGQLSIIPSSRWCIKNLPTERMANDISVRVLDQKRSLGMVPFHMLDKHYLTENPSVMVQHFVLQATKFVMDSMIGHSPAGILFRESDKMLFIVDDLEERRMDDKHLSVQNPVEDWDIILFGRSINKREKLLYEQLLHLGLNRSNVTYGLSKQWTSMEAQLLSNTKADKWINKGRIKLVRKMLKLAS